MNQITGYSSLDPRKEVLGSSELLPLITSGVSGDTKTCVPRVCRQWKEIHNNTRDAVVLIQLASRNWRIIHKDHYVGYAITLGLLNVPIPSKYSHLPADKYAELLNNLAPIAGNRMIGLVLQKCQIGDRIQCLEGFPMLQELDLLSTVGDDAMLSYLANLSHLTQLDLSDNRRITDAGIAHIVGLRKLNQLDLSCHFLITDAGLAHLVDLRELRQVNLHGTEITNAGLEHLARLSALRFEL